MNPFGGVGRLHTCHGHAAWAPLGPKGHLDGTFGCGGDTAPAEPGLVPDRRVIGPSGGKGGLRSGPGAWWGLDEPLGHGRGAVKPRDREGWGETQGDHVPDVRLGIQRVRVQGPRYAVPLAEGRVEHSPGGGLGLRPAPCAPGDLEVGVEWAVGLGHGGRRPLIVQERVPAACLDWVEAGDGVALPTQHTAAIVVLRRNQVVPGQGGGWVRRRRRLGTQGLLVPPACRITHPKVGAL